MKLSLIPAAALAIVVPAATTFGEVLHVGGAAGDFSQITDAVAAAEDGDTIRVRNGDYERFAVDDKQLTIVGLGNAVRVFGVTRVRNLSTGKTVRFSRLDFRGSGAGALEALIVYDNDGQVQLQECAVRGAPGSLWMDDYHGCGRGMLVLNSSAVTLSDCTVVGGSGPYYDDWGNMYDPVPGAAGVVVGELGSPSSVSRLVIHGGDLHGGDGSDAEDRGRYGEHGAPAIHILDDSGLWVFGATISGGDGGFGADEGIECCGNGGNGAPALVVAPQGAQADIREQDNVWIPGVGGWAGGGYCDDGSGGNYEPCSPGANAAPTSVAPGATFANLPGAARRLSLPVTSFDDQVVDLSVTGEPGDLVHLQFSTVPAFVARPRGVLLLGQLRWSLTQPIGVIPASGVLTRSMPTPATGAFLAYTLGAQATVRDSGGSRYLSEARWITVIDAAWQ